MKTSTNFFIDPYTDEGMEPNAKDVAIAKFCEKALFDNLDRWFKGLIEDINLYIRDWFSLFELYFERKDDWFYPQLTRIYADTVFKWLTSTWEPWIQQIAYYTKATQETDDPEANEGKNTIDIPSNKLILFNINSEWINYEGRSLYRKIAKDRFFKDKFENYHAVLQERLAIPPLKVKVPQWTTDDEIEKYKSIAENMRSLESWYVVEQIDPATWASLVGYDWMNTNIGDNANKLQDAIQHYAQNINDIFFQQFLYLWKSKKGSYGMAWQSTAFFFEAVKWLLEKDMEVINKYLIPKIVALNFWETKRMPKVKFGQIWLVDPSEFSSTMSALVGGGIITANYDTERYVRELLHLPMISEEQYNESKQQASPDMAPAVEEDEVETAKAERQAKKEADKLAKEQAKKHTDCGCENINFSWIDFDHESIIQHQIDWLEESDDVWKRNFSDPIQDGFWRPLTFAERRVAIKSIKDNLNEETDSLRKQYSEVTDEMTNKLLAQVQTLIEKNDMTAISALTAKYGAEISSMVTLAYKKNFDYWKNEASREIGVQIPESKKDLKDVIKIQADNVSEWIISKVTTDTKAIIATAITKNDWLKNTPSSGVVVSVKKAVKPYLDQAFWIVSTIWINQAFNSWRKSVAYTNASKIYGAQYSAIIDWRTSNRCLSLDGTVVKVDSDDYKNYSPPQHIHCRSMRVFINDDEEYKPDYTEVSSSIPVKDTITSKEELKVPVLSKDSPAVAQITKEIDWRMQKNESLNWKRKEKNQEIIDRLKKSIE